MYVQHDYFYISSKLKLNEKEIYGDSSQWHDIMLNYHSIED
jgi:hypothetical protein